ncbi:class I SAM-dependent methyltransferase, partial [Patescibacteria group bacterium]|nr:class I SAM-dependent methyltransferase [Patescibacteria group bacterium]
CAKGNQNACAYVLPAIANPIPGMSLASQYADDLAALFKPVTNFFDDLAWMRNLPNADDTADWTFGTYGGQTPISAYDLIPSPDGSYRQPLYEWEEDMLAYEARYLNLNKGISEETLPYGLPTHEEILNMASSDTLKELTPEGIRRSLYGFNPHATSSQRYLTDNPRIGYEIALTQQRLGNPNLTCLDVGCSSGIAANALQQTMPELQIAGVDVVNHLEVNLPFIQTAGHNLQLPAESVDVIIAANMMGYLPADYIEGALLSELQRVLRPGGLLVGGMDWWSGFSNAPRPELFYFIKP